MTQAEDLVRSTTRALAETVQAVRPLPPLPQASATPAEVSHGRGWHRAGWLLPLAAAASVVVIVLASVVVLVTEPVMVLPDCLTVLESLTVVDVGTGGLERQLELLLDGAAVDGVR